MSATRRKLTEEERSIIKLIGRSQDLGDGWRRVSLMLWGYVLTYAPRELVEIDRENLRIKLNHDGEVVLRYL